MCTTLCRSVQVYLDRTVGQSNFVPAVPENVHRGGRSSTKSCQTLLDAKRTKVIRQEKAPDMNRQMRIILSRPVKLLKPSIFHYRLRGLQQRFPGIFSE